MKTSTDKLLLCCEYIYIYIISHAFNLNFILQFVVGGLTGIRSAVFGFSGFYYEAARKTVFSHFIFLAVFELHAV